MYNMENGGDKENGMHLLDVDSDRSEVPLMSSKT